MEKDALFSKSRVRVLMAQVYEKQTTAAIRLNRSRRSTSTSTGIGTSTSDEQGRSRRAPNSRRHRFIYGDTTTATEGRARGGQKEESQTFEDLHSVCRACQTQLKKDASRKARQDKATAFWCVGCV